jgi:hypothetical protein
MAGERHGPHAIHDFPGGWMASRDAGASHGRACSPSVTDVDV